jgi:hypothetical protein
MENCAMREPKLEVNLWGFRINAVGTLAICAAVLIFLAALAAWRFDRNWGAEGRNSLERCLATMSRRLGVRFAQVFSSGRDSLRQIYPRRDHGHVCKALVAAPSR